MRSAHRPAVTIAVLLATVAMVGGIVAGRRVPWNDARVRLTPTAWLVRHLDDNNAIAARARTELDRRLQAQGTSDSTRGRIARALMEMKATARTNVRAGESLPITLVMHQPTAAGRAAAFGAAPPLPYRVWIAADPPRVNGEQKTDRKSLTMGGMTISSEATFWRECRPFEGPSAASVLIPADTPPGPVEVELIYHFRLIAPEQRPSITSGSGHTYQRDLNADDPAVDAWTQTLRVAATVLPADAEDDVEMVVDPAQRDAVHAAIRVVGPRGWGAATQPTTIELRSIGEGRAQADFSIETWNSPVPLAMSIALREPGTDREIVIGGMFFLPRKSGSISMFPPVASQRLLAAWTSPTATVVLRSSKQIARGHAELSRIWGDKIEFENVPVQVAPARQPPTTRP